MSAHGLERLLFAALFSCLGACASPLVGLECKPGFTRCDQICVDLQMDPQHCGSCGRECATGAMCAAGSCSNAIGDGGPDASGSADAGTQSPLCEGEGSADDCICGFGELKCGTICVQAGTDPNNCGQCGLTCDAEDFCVNGGCLADCDSPLVACGATCIDLTTNIDHCGGCFSGCASALCTAGVCQGASAGHVVVIGHDMSGSRAALNRLVGNAIFLPFASPLRILMYDKDTSAASKLGVANAIDAYALTTGRGYKITAGVPLTVPFLLRSAADVFVIHSQQASTDELLKKNGTTWSAALREFVKRGGTVVLFDGGGSHAGTYQILKAAGLFNANSRTPLSARDLDLVAPADALATGVSSIYRSQGNTVGFDTTLGTVVVEDPKSDLPVVIHSTP